MITDKWEDFVYHWGSRHSTLKWFEQINYGMYPTYHPEINRKYKWGIAKPDESYNPDTVDRFENVPFRIERRDPDTFELLTSWDEYLVDVDTEEPFIRIAENLVMYVMGLNISDQYNPTTFYPQKMPMINLVSNKYKFLLRIPLITLLLLGRETLDWENIPSLVNVLDEWLPVCAMIRRMHAFTTQFAEDLENNRWTLNILISRSRILDLIDHIKAEDENVYPYAIEYWEIQPVSEGDEHKWVPIWLQDLSLYQLWFQWKESELIKIDPESIKPHEVSMYSLSEEIDKRIAEWENTEKTFQTENKFPSWDVMFAAMPNNDFEVLPQNFEELLTREIPYLIRSISGGIFRPDIHAADFMYFYENIFQQTLRIIEISNAIKCFYDESIHKDIIMVDSCWDSLIEGDFCGLITLFDLIMPQHLLGGIFSHEYASLVKRENTDAIRNVLTEYFGDVLLPAQAIIRQLVYLRNVAGLNVDCQFSKILSNEYVIDNYYDAEGYADVIQEIYQFDNDAQLYEVAFEQEELEHFRQYMKDSASGQDPNPGLTLMRAAFEDQKLPPKFRLNLITQLESANNPLGNRYHPFNYTGRAQDIESGDWERSVGEEENLQVRARSFHRGMATDQDIDARIKKRKKNLQYLRKTLDPDYNPDEEDDELQEDDDAEDVEEDQDSQEGEHEKEAEE